MFQLSLEGVFNKVAIGPGTVSHAQCEDVTKNLRMDVEEHPGARHICDQAKSVLEQLITDELARLVP